MEKVVKIYSRDGCGACVSAKTFMDNKNIKYEILDVGVDNKAMKELRAAGVMSLPFIKIGDVEIMGFNPTAVLDAIK